MQKLDSTTLAARIMNCLQTILELEPMLRRLDSGQILLSEFKVLKAFLNDLDGLSLDEDDVARIETATEHFLQELKTPVTFTFPGSANRVTLQ
jgi:hypothetical protein